MAFFTRARRRSIYLALFILAMLNFAAFWLISMQIGGDALAGKVENGHYFLLGHGVYAEVSEGVYTYSRWHALSLWVSHPLGAMAAVFWYKLSAPEGSA
ncbi:MAG TPA: hypothetical protein VGN52_08540 [Burkholderiales bacterium]|jgi:hypothetical protein